MDVFENAHDVIARFGEGDALDPVDRIDIGIARIAIFGDPFISPPPPGIIGGKGQYIGAAKARNIIAER